MDPVEIVFFAVVWNTSPQLPAKHYYYFPLRGYSPPPSPLTENGVNKYFPNYVFLFHSFSNSSANVWIRKIQVLISTVCYEEIFFRKKQIGNHSCPSTTGRGCPGIPFNTIAARPFCSRIEALFTKWPVFSPSSCPVCRARALPSFRNCSRATLCHPPKDSATIGMNATLVPCRGPRSPCTCCWTSEWEHDQASQLPPLYRQ